MATRKKSIGVTFPFRDSNEGDYINLNSNPENEIRSNLIHLLMTRKGERFWLPEFGTNLHQYIFENITEETKDAIRGEIRDSVERFLPNLKIETIDVTDYLYDGIEEEMSKELTLTIKINYKFTSNTFEFNDLIVLNL